MNNDKFQTIVKGNKYEELYNPNQNFSCQYYTEDEFIIKNRNGDDFLNICSLNIRSVHKHGGELLNFLGSLKTDFHVIILTVIGSRNLTVVENMLPNYTFFHKIPSLSNIGILDETDIVLDCDCVKCEVWSRKFVCWIHVQWCNVHRRGYL